MVEWFLNAAEQHIMFITYQVLNGLNYMHTAGVWLQLYTVESQVCFTGTSSHKTFSSTTRSTFVVLSFVSSKLPQVRICDLGLARVKSPGGEAATGYVTTRWYRAPEV